MTQLRVMLNTINDVKKFVDVINRADFEADIATGKYVVDAKSIMGIFSLDLSKPLDLTIHADKEKTADLLEEIKSFIVK